MEALVLLLIAVPFTCVLAAEIEIRSYDEYTWEEDGRQYVTDLGWESFGYGVGLTLLLYMLMIICCFAACCKRCGGGKADDTIFVQPQQDERTGKFRVNWRMIQDLKAKDKHKYGLWIGGLILIVSMSICGLTMYFYLKEGDDIVIRTFGSLTEVIDDVGNYLCSNETDADTPQECETGTIGNFVSQALDELDDVVEDINNEIDFALTLPPNYTAADAAFAVYTPNIIGDPFGTTPTTSEVEEYFLYIPSLPSTSSSLQDLQQAVSDILGFVNNDLPAAGAVFNSTGLSILTNTPLGDDTFYTEWALTYLVIEVCFNDIGNEIGVIINDTINPLRLLIDGDDTNNPGGEDFVAEVNDLANEVFADTIVPLRDQILEYKDFNIYVTIRDYYEEYNDYYIWVLTLYFFIPAILLTLTLGIAFLLKNRTPLYCDMCHTCFCQWTYSLFGGLLLVLVIVLKTFCNQHLDFAIKQLETANDGQPLTLELEGETFVIDEFLEDILFCPEDTSLPKSDFVEVFGLQDIINISEYAQDTTSELLDTIDDFQVVADTLVEFCQGNLTGEGSAVGFSDLFLTDWRNGFDGAVVIAEVNDYLANVLPADPYDVNVLDAVQDSRMEDSYFTTDIITDPTNGLNQEIADTEALLIDIFAASVSGRPTDFAYLGDPVTPFPNPLTRANFDTFLLSTITGANAEYWNQTGATNQNQSFFDIDYSTRTYDELVTLLDSYTSKYNSLVAVSGINGQIRTELGVIASTAGDVETRLTNLENLLSSELSAFNTSQQLANTVFDRVLNLIPRFQDLLTRVRNDVVDFALSAGDFLPCYIVAKYYDRFILDLLCSGVVGTWEQTAIAMTFIALFTFFAFVIFACYGPFVTKDTEVRVARPESRTNTSRRAMSAGEPESYESYVARQTSGNPRAAAYPEVVAEPIPYGRKA